MPLPTVYTEPQLAQYMARIIGPSVAATLDWLAEGEISDDVNADGNYTNLGDYEEPVYETLFALGVSDISTLDMVSEIRGLRAVARWQIWKHARAGLADVYDEGAGVVRSTRSQMYEQALKNERQAFGEAMPHLPGYHVTMEIAPAQVVASDDTEFG